MLIEAAGKTWIVVEQDLTHTLWAGGEGFSGVTFRNLGPESDELHVRWVRRPPRFTRRIAEELFEMAGARTWRDPRDGRLWELRLEADAAPRSEHGTPVPLEVIRFRSGPLHAEATWPLAKPLGWASDRELTALLDEVLAERGSGRRLAG